MKKKYCAVMLLFATLVILFGNVAYAKDNIVIYSSCDEQRNKFFLEALKAEFPDVDFDILYFPTGTNGARLLSEGADTEADIVIGLEISYLNRLKDNLASLERYDDSVFIEDIRDADKKYIPWERFSCVIAINENVLNEKGLAIPTTYDDLLKPEYKGLVSMPNPQSSSTGHLFLFYFVDTLGEEAAFQYFDALAENVNQFPSSGSGITTALVNGDIAVGFTMTFNSVNEIDRGAVLSLHYFDNCAPSSLAGISIIEKSDMHPMVYDVFEYLATDINRKDKELYSPESVFIDQETTKAHYPTDIPYKLYVVDEAEKERLLDQWMY